MNSWEFAVSISQTSINANIEENALTHTFPWAMEWKNEKRRRGSSRQRQAEAFIATFTMSRIQLLSDGQAILWVQVCSEDEI